MKLLCGTFFDIANKEESGAARRIVRSIAPETAHTLCGQATDLSLTKV
jgi:hypothetical protein